MSATAALVSSSVAPLAAAFASVRFWVFDLDNTLYPAETDLFAQIDARIRDYVARLMGVGGEVAQAVQRDYYRRYGTTLAGLMTEYDVDADDFLAYVHDIDHSVVSPDPRLAAALERLPGDKFVFTNGSARHAEKTLARIGIGGCFRDVFDIAAAGLVPKPHPVTYDGFIARTGLEPSAAAMFEDLARNLKVPRDRGMRTVLVVPRGEHAEFRDAWEPEGEKEAHVEFVSDDLAGFLDAVADAIGA